MNRNDNPMYCKGCDQHHPRSYFAKRLDGAAHHVLCEKCRVVRAGPVINPIEPAPATAPRLGAFIVGYGPQLFGDVKLDNIKPVDRDRALLVGEIYNANGR